MPEGWWQAGAWLLNPPHAKNTKPDSVLSKSGGHVWGGGGLQSFERAGDGTHEEQPASLGSAGEMSMTILAERRYLRTERRQTEDLSTRPAAHRLSILSDVGCSSRPVSSLRIHLRTYRQPKNNPLTHVPARQG